MRSHKLHHICNLSPIIIFRSVEDFLIAISRMAACAYVNYVDILAFSIMSTHFHIIARGDPDNIAEFIKLYKLNVGRWHNNTYRTSLKLTVGSRGISGDEESIAVMNYVLKNPIHHGISNTVFSYPYSSTDCYFRDDLIRSERFPGEILSIRDTSPTQLSKTNYRKLFGSQEVAETLKIVDNRLVIPESFISIDAVETIYSTPKNFLYQMNKPLKEDVEMFGSDIEAINNHSSKGLLTGQISDLRACEIMDAAIHPRSYAEIVPEEKSELWKYLKRLGVNYSQFGRMG